MAAGLPVVAVDATGTCDAVTHGCEGLLTENEAPALTQAISRVLNSSTLRECFSNAALRRAQTFSIEAQARKLVSVYAQAIEDQRAGRFVHVANSKLQRQLGSPVWSLARSFFV